MKKAGDLPYDPTHPVFTLPASGDQTIWRYLDLAKLVALLKDRAIYLSRADRLEDPFEGSTTRLVTEERAAHLIEEGSSPKFAEAWSKALRETRSYTYVNCWHLSPYESAAMWSLYARQGLGVAIRSTIPRLTQTLTDNLVKTPEVVHVGVVHYIDYSTDWIPEGNVLWPYVHKRKSFEHEKELRVVTTILPRIIDGENPVQEPSADGFLAPVDPNLLVEELYVAPGSGKWFRDVVQATTKNFGLDRQVHESSLDGTPVY